MSAYVVEDKTINTIAAWLRANKTTTQYWEHRPELRPIWLATHSEDDLAELGTELHELNVRAVNQRYDEDNHETYSYKREIPTSDMHALKSMDCLIYQMSEGDVPETPLYLALFAASRELAHSIVSRSDAYAASRGW
jgi:hypothetical protein